MENDNQNLTPQAIPQVPALKKWYQHKGIIAIIILAILTAIVSLAYFNFAKPQNIEPLVNNHKSTATPISTSTEVSQASSTPTTQADQQFMYVPSQLKQLPDLNLVKYRDGDPTAQVQYFEVQSVDVAGAKLILASDGYCDGLGCTPGYYRFLQTDKTFTLLTKYSAPVDGSFGLAKTDLNTSLTSNMDVPALDIPTQLQDPSTNAIVKLDDYSFTTGDLFNPQNKILVFTANGYSVFFANTGAQSETYYVQAADGKQLTYELSDPFIINERGDDFTSILNIKWSDGQSHNNNFQFDPAGDADGFGICQEGQDYVKSVSATKVSQNDLTVVGTNSSGQSVYGFKNINNPILKAAQAQIAALHNKAHNNPSDIVIFWKDPFSRLIRFVSSDMLDVCGA